MSKPAHSGSGGGGSLQTTDKTVQIKNEIVDNIKYDKFGDFNCNECYKYKR